MTTDVKTSRPELLAPAGDWEAMRAAVANGADAVYFGLDHFNARYRAKNFSLEELPKVMDYLHGHNVKGFVTFNTLIFSDELSEAVKYLSALAKAGVDAVLVQDLGVADLLRRLAPSLPVHGSTQMTLTEPRGIEFVRGLGVKRVVLARELSLKDIEKIAAAKTAGEGTGATLQRDIFPELEVFIHGALCVSYSGQCLTSESLGGRSANRGQCAQACRLPYQLLVDGAVRDLGDKQYLLSPSDLAAYDLIGDLTKLGVACFKIEGRLKSAHYVAATTQTYRAAIDAAVSDEKFEITPQAKLDLEQTFSRTFTHGFLSGVNHQQLVGATFSKARGTRIGIVESVTEMGINVKLEVAAEFLKAGDGVVFDEGRPEQDEQGGRVFQVRTVPGNRIQVRLGMGEINMAYINPGATLWKTDDPHIKKRLAHSFSRETVVKRVGVDFVVTARVGEHLKLVARAEGHEASAEYSEKVLEAARKFAFDEATAREQLSRLGDTPYEISDLKLEISGGPMVPKSVLNDLRRQCVEELLRKRTRAHVVVDGVLEKMRGEVSESHPPARKDAVRFHLLVRTMEQLDEALKFEGPTKITSMYADFEDVRRYKEAVEKCRAAGMKLALATLRIVKPGEDGLMQQILDCSPDAVLVRNLAAISFFKEKSPGLEMLGDYSLNVSNELTAALYHRQGISRMAPSYDLNFSQLGAMLSRIDAGMFEVVIHQHMPMFHMEHCVFAHVLSNGKDFRDCGRPCEKHKVDLTDRVGEPHPLIPDVGCRNTVFNAQAQSGAEYLPRMLELGVQEFRVELLRENAASARRVMEHYSKLLAGESEPRAMVRSLRVLNQLGVTSGTLLHE